MLFLFGLIKYFFLLQENQFFFFWGLNFAIIAKSTLVTLRLPFKALFKQRGRAKQIHFFFPSPAEPCFSSSRALILPSLHSCACTAALQPCLSHCRRHPRCCRRPESLPPPPVTATVAARATAASLCVPRSSASPIAPLPASPGLFVSRVPTARSSVISSELWFSRVRSPGCARALPLSPF